MSEQLWAPWRFSYVSGNSTGKKYENIFLELPEEQDDEKNLILHRGELAFIILNAYPYSNGHLMVAPFSQVAEIDQLTDAELLEINKLVQRSVGWLRSVFKPHGFNIGINMGMAAGAGIPVHIHWHVVPRWAGDTNFMTTVGETRVISDSLHNTYCRLREAKEATN